MKKTTLALFLVAGISVGADKRTNTERIPKVDVCEVLSAVAQFDGVLLTIHGKVRATDEGGWLVGDACPGVVTTEGYKWPSVIYLAMPTTTRRIHPVDFRFDIASEKRVNSAYRSLERRHIPEECMEFTYTGLFETRMEWSRSSSVLPSGDRKFIGFGHLSAAPAQLLLKSKDGVVPIPGCKAKLANHSKSPY